MVRSIHDGSEWWKEFLRLWRVGSTAPRYSALLAKRRPGSRRRVTLTYPGITQLPGANCRVTTGPTARSPLTSTSNVKSPVRIDNRLHEVTASTMTLQQPANTVPPISGIGGSLFNLIDVAQGYTFHP